MEDSVDSVIIRLARRTYYGSKDVSCEEDIEPILHKKSLNEDQRKKLLRFIEISKPARPLSMRDMKREIFEIVGSQEATDSYTNVISRTELEIIYNWIKQVKQE